MSIEVAAILSLAPWSRDGSGMAEIAGSQPSVEPDHEAVNIVNGNSQPIAQRPCVRHHVRALEQNGADARVFADQRIACIEDVLLSCGHVHRLLIADQNARELSPSVSADHRQGWVQSDGDKMIARQAGRADSNDPDPPSDR